MSRPAAFFRRIDLGPGDAGTPGRNPIPALITTTLRRLAVLSRILEQGTTVRTNDTTANQAHLLGEFLAWIVGLDSMDGLEVVFAMPACGLCVRGRTSGESVLLGVL